MLLVDVRQNLCLTTTPSRTSQLVEAIRCWWRWLPKEDVEVREGEDEEGEGEGQQTQGGAGGSGQQQRKGGGLGEGGAGAEARVDSGDKVQVVSNVLSRAIYSAMVVAISMVGGVG